MTSTAPAETRGPTSAGAAIEALDVTAGYGADPVLAGVSVRVAPGELVALVGPNGAGKSTLVRVLAGTLAPRSGSVRLGSSDLASLGRAEVARRLAVCPQEAEVAFGFSVREVVMMGRAPYQGRLLLASDEDQEAVDEALATCELLALADRPVLTLSGGERRRVVVARAMAQRTRVLLLDEPAAHLDVRHTVAVFEQVRTLVTGRGVACLAVVHDLNAAVRWADRAVLLSRGAVYAEGPASEVLSVHNLEPVFGVALEAMRDEGGATYFVPRAVTRHAARST